MPISCDTVENHPIHSERFVIGDDLTQAIETTRASGGKIVAGGTTVCRALEAWAVGHHGETDLMILPGHPFNVVDALLTNFHTPRSTLLALVAAMAERQGADAGIDFVKKVYAAAIDNDYRFYSYGDASLWLPPKS